MATIDEQFRDLFKRAEEVLNYCGEAVTVVDRVKLKEEITKISNNNEPRLINDAIHGPVELTSLVYKIINTTEFHRLKDIKQLGAANYVYPGANHTRFDHSIGVYHLAGEFAKHLQKQLQLDVPEGKEDLWKFSDEEVLCAEIAGLCHDLGHGPLSHMFERHVLESLTDSELKHEDLSIIIFRRLLANNVAVLAEFVNEGLGANEVKLIELMIKPKKGRKLPDPWKHREFLCEIVANKVTGVDVDKWDYYVRDCYYLGITNDFQRKRCMLLGRIVETEDGELHVAFRDKELDNIYGMFRTRGILHQKAYQHKTVKAVERMIADALLLVKDTKLITIKGSTEAKSMIAAIDEAKAGNTDTYLALTDAIVALIKYYPLGSPNEIAVKKAKEILHRVEVRDLYHCSWKVRVPKMLIVSGHEAADDNPHHNGRLWRAMQSMKYQPQGAAIYDLLDDETKGRIKIEDLWVEFETIQVPSEENDNPVDKVMFYEKPKSKNHPPAVLKNKEVKDNTSMLVVPQSFIECEVRLYDKRETSKHTTEDRDALKKALLEWKKQADIKHNGSSTDADT